MTGLQEALANWFETNKRELPWHTLPTPYHVWLSEIILQQTRVSVLHVGQFGKISKEIFRVHCIFL